MGKMDRRVLLLPCYAHDNRANNVLRNLMAAAAVVVRRRSGLVGVVPDANGILIKTGRVLVGLSKKKK